MNPRLSVLLTSYHNGPMLLEALDHLDNQTCKDFETIVLDDNSPDCSMGECLWRPDIRLYKSDVHDGDRWAKARYAVQVNVGLKLAVGEFVGYCCDDDFWEPQKVERVLAFFDAHPDANVVVGFQRLVNEVHGRTVRNYEPLVEMLPDGTGLLHCDPFCVVDHSSVVHRWPIRGGEEGWPTQPVRIADAYFWRQLYRAGNVFHVIPKILDTHRYHEKSISSRLDRHEELRGWIA